MNDIPKRDAEVFAEAAPMPAGERDAYLTRACQGDEALRQRVEALLQSHEQLGDFLELPPAAGGGSADTAPPVMEAPGDHIGRYKLLQVIGEGGCGVVYMAEQEEPVRRRVALKIIKPGMDTRSVIARFEAERQALALMDHPNIAKVFDAGATGSGRPYFVMELVRGIKITDYCDERALPIGERLNLFVQVCQAVQHAHQKGIIHRDIKPSNILVTLTGAGAALPVVIDFGIAKATTHQRLTDKTLFTAFELLIGTPAYMSPEQAALTSVDVDTRTDIYSLGVLLYELLTGKTPFDQKELLAAGVDELRRTLRDREPVKPSTRATLERLARASNETGTHCPRSEINPDLDWIVMKALEKDRSRRYETASALALDVRHFLANEPVSARPPSPLYKLKKLALRNKLLFTSLGVIGLLLAVSFGIVMQLLAQERAARREADQARTQAEADKRSAEAAATKSQQVTSFLQEMLHGVDPAVALGRDTTLLREILDRTAARVSAELTNQPAVEAALRLTLGEVYEEIGAYPQAQEMLRRVLEINQRFQPENRIQRATALNRLGLVLLREHKLDEAEQQVQASLALWQELNQGSTDPAAVTLETLAMIRWQQGRLDEAEAMMRGVYTLRQKLLPADSAELLNTLSNLGNVLYSAKRHLEAEQLYRQLLDAKLKQHGESHPSVAHAIHNLGVCLSAQGKFEEAKVHLTRALTLRQKLLGEQHPVSVLSMGSLAEALRRSGNHAEAEAIYRETLAWERKQWGSHHRTTLLTAHNLALALHSQRKHQELDVLLAEVLTPEYARDPRSETLLQLRAERSARAGRWQDAADDAAKVVEFKPEEHQHYHTLAPLLVATGNTEAYATLCQEIVRRFSGTTSISTADRMAKDCLILPLPGLDLKAVTALADFTVTRGKGRTAYPFYQFCKALAEYRQGHFSAAAEWAAAPAEVKFPYAAVEAGAVLAMAQHQLKQPDAARASLAKASTIFATKLPQLESGDLGGDWRDWLIARVLLQEARTLIEGKAGE